MLVGVGAVVATVSVVAGVAALIGGDRGSNPADVAEAFAAAWSDGDTAELQDLVADPASLERVDPVAVTERLGATAAEVTIVGVAEDGDEASASFDAELTLGDVGAVRWHGRLPMRQAQDAGWVVEWHESALHPSLPPGGSVTRAVSWPERAPILGAGGHQLVGAQEMIRVGIEPQRFDRAASIPILAEQLGLDPAAIERALDAPGVESDQFVQIAEVSPEEFEAARAVVFPIPGVTFPRGRTRAGPTDGFARHLIGRFGEATAERLEELGSPYRIGDRVGLDGLEARFERQLAGLPGIDVHVLDRDGAVVATLASFPATSPEPLHTTLDRGLQAAAEAALDGVAVPAALVAVDAASGEVRASASRPLDEPFNRATRGAYPPGSTFKVVTAYALLANGVHLDSSVDCPAELGVDGRRFRNFEGGAAGIVPFSQAFAESCNTAIIGAASSLPERALVAAADAFGFGVDYSLGTSTVGGAFPEPTTAVERAAAAIGQADVTASPLHMATVAAAALNGTWRSPVLLPGTPDERLTRPLEPSVREQLVRLMRLVVTEGTGTAADLPGRDVLGKTGTAEFGTDNQPRTHAWFIAAVDNLGVAVVLEGGGVGGRDAAPIAARFLRALPS